MQIVADANVPHAEAALGPFGAVRRVPGREITRAALADADALVVRSVTAVDAALLGGTPVRFVGSATAGTDHVDAAALGALGVAFAHAPGSNAASVVDWVLAALLALAADRGEGLDGKVLGVVGVGEVGGRLVPRARALGLRVLACDPPRAETGRRDHDYRPLADVLTASDVVSLHTPLTEGGPHPTLGLVDAEATGRMRAGAWLLNAARGRVVTAEAARELAETRPVALDVWPAEPSPDASLVGAVVLGTPHVAGYALDAKVRGTAVIAGALRRWLADQGRPTPEPWAPDLGPDPAPLDAPNLPHATSADRARWLDALVRRVYDVRADDERFRAALAEAGPEPEARAAAFAGLRKSYPERRELSRFSVCGPVPPALAEAVTLGLGMRVA